MSEFSWKDGPSRTITVKDVKLEAVCFGAPPDKAPTIVMLHEGLGCAALWRDFPEKLAEETGYGVFVYSRAGYGNSDPCDLPRPLDYMTREATDVLGAILDHIGFRQGVLLGHSDGASIAAIYAGSRVDFRVRGLILMAPHFFTEEAGLRSIAEARQNYENGDLRKKLAKYHAHVDCAFRGWNDAWLDAGFREWNVSEVIDYLRIPVLAIQGRDDRYGTLDQIEEIRSRIYSPLDVEILDDCGHAPHLEKQEKTLSAITGYLARLERIEKAEVVVA